MKTSEELKIIGKSSNIDCRLNELADKVKELESIVIDVAHIGVDMGDCSFYLSDSHIEKARGLIESW